jgi:hypothetical protein
MTTQDLSYFQEQLQYFSERVEELAHALRGDTQSLALDIGYTSRDEVHGPPHGRTARPPAQTRGMSRIAADYDPHQRGPGPCARAFFVAQEQARNRAQSD